MHSIRIAPERLIGYFARRERVTLDRRERTSMAEYIGSPSSDRFFGTHHDDTIIGSGGDDFLSAQSGSDFIDGGDRSFDAWRP